MDTDKQLYKLFAAAPAQMYQLLGLPVPGPLRAHSETFKDVQTESDLVVEPAAEAEPARLLEFQGYRDKRFVPKVMFPLLAHDPSAFDISGDTKNDRETAGSRGTALGQRTQRTLDR